jgi:hypothetical protein
MGSKKSPIVVDKRVCVHGLPWWCYGSPFTSVLHPWRPGRRVSSGYPIKRTALVLLPTPFSYKARARGEVKKSWFSPLSGILFKKIFPSSLDGGTNWTRALTVSFLCRVRGVRVRRRDCVSPVGSTDLLSSWQRSRPLLPYPARCSWEERIRRWRRRWRVELPVLLLSPS